MQTYFQKCLWEFTLHLREQLSQEDLVFLEEVDKPLSWAFTFLSGKGHQTGNQHYHFVWPRWAGESVPVDRQNVYAGLVAAFLWFCGCFQAVSPWIEGCRPQLFQMFCAMHQLFHPYHEDTGNLVEDTEAFRQPFIKLYLLLLFSCIFSCF